MKRARRAAHAALITLALSALVLFLNNKVF